MMARAQLTNRRSHEAFDFAFSRGPNRPSHVYTCGYGVTDDGQISEIFLDSHKLASDLTDDARDMAVVLSIALQHGVPLQRLRHAVTRLEDGQPVGLAGRLMEELAERAPGAFEARPAAPPPAVAAPEPMVPCPDCTDGFTTAGDRHARTRQDVCKRCGGEHVVPAETGRTAEASFDPAGAPEAAVGRDLRQEQMRRWIVGIWGEDALAPHERVERLLEETIELAQAEALPGGMVLPALKRLVDECVAGFTLLTPEVAAAVANARLAIEKDALATIAAHVYAKEPGEPPQEVGGISTCLLAYCASRALSADACERAELTRILGKSVEHFRARHQAKVSAGMARAFIAPTEVGA